MLELGRYLVGEAGLYVCKVIDRKVSRGPGVLVTDGGCTTTSPPRAISAGAAQELPVAIGNRMQGTEREIASVVGPL